MKKFLATVFAALFLLPVLIAPLAQATDIDLIKPDFLPGPSESTEIGSDTQDYVLNTTIPRALNIVIGLAGIASFVVMVIAAINLLTAYGNEDKINRAKNNLRYALIGFVVVLFSYAIVSIIVSVSLPQESHMPKSYALLPVAHAVQSSDIDILLPGQEELIEQHDEQNRVSLPSGDFITEIVPAFVTNLFFLVGFLLFIALMYGGVLLIVGRGNEDMTTKAKNILIWSLAAIMVISLGYAIIYGIATISFDEDPSTTADDVFTEAIENE